MVTLASSGTHRAAAILLASVVLASCGGSSHDRLVWCSENQAKVAQAAIALGLLDAGTQYGEWKATDPAGYDRACEVAFDGR